MPIGSVYFDCLASCAQTSDPIIMESPVRRTVVLTGAAQEHGRIQDAPACVVRRRSRIRWRGPFSSRWAPLPCTNKRQSLPTSEKSATSTLH
jgi:hypothetical protein